MRKAAMRGLKRFQSAVRPVRRMPQPAHIAGERAALLHYSGDRDIAQHCNLRRTKPVPVVLIPSLINPHTILDLAPHTSLARYLARRGHDVWLVDWGEPTPADQGMDLADHIEQLLMPLLDALAVEPVLVGYCLGGTLAAAVAQLRPARALACLATPWDFAGYAAHNRQAISDLWSSNLPACEAIGLLPMEVMQAGFWNLDASRTIRKFGSFGERDGRSQAARLFVAVEDWANEGAPLTLGAGRDLFERFYGGNATAEGAWSVGGRSISLDAINCPTLSIRSLTDRIVPIESSPALAEDLPVALGHVGMIVSRDAPEVVWKPLSEWIARYDRG